MAKSDYTILGPLGNLKKNKIKDALEARFDSALKHREAYEEHWRNSMDFYLGRQWRIYDARLKQYTDENPDDLDQDYVQKVVHNIIASTSDALISHVTRTDPQPSCEPRTGEEEDADIARLVIALEKWLWEKLNWRDKHLDFLQWLFTCDICFYKWGWDATKSPMTPAGLSLNTLLTSLPNDIDARVIEGLILEKSDKEIKKSVEDGLESLEDQQVYPLGGDIFLDVVNPFEIAMEPNANSFEEARWFFHAIAVNRAEAEARFGKKIVDKAKEAELTGNHLAGFSRERYSTIGDGVGEASVPEDTETFENEQDYIYVCEYWERPSKEFPQGRRILWVGDEIWEGKIPGNSGEPPFGYVCYSKVFSRPTGQSLVERLKPLQIRYNRIVSTVHNILRFHGIPRLAHGLNTKLSQISDIPGETLQFSGQPPFYIQPPPLDPAWFQYMEIVRNEAFDEAGLHSLSRGEYPQVQHALPGVAIQLLQERDDARLTPLFKRLDSVLTKAATGLLSLIQRYYSDEQIEMIVGRLTSKDGQAIAAFQQTDFQQRFDLRMRTVSGLPDSPAAKRQLIIDLYQLQAFGVPGDPVTSRRLLSLLEFPVDEKIFSSDDTLMEQIQNAVSQRIQGGQPGQPGQPNPTGGL